MSKEISCPNLYIVGAPKCGTTSIYYYLSQHSEIYCPEFKEPHHFNTDDSYRFITDKLEYLDLYKDGINSIYRCDGSTMYYYSKSAIENILQEKRDAKFIFLIRNPIEHFYSLHQQMVFNGDEIWLNPEEAWLRQEQRALSKNIPINCINPKAIHYSNSCALGSHLETLSETLGKEQLLTVLLDDLKTNPKTVLNNIYSFLNLKQNLNLDLEVKNESVKYRKSLTLKRVSRVLYKLKRKLNINFSFGILKWLDEKNKGESKSNSVATNIGNNPNLNTVLLGAFEQDIMKIEKILNRDLRHWRDIAEL